MIGFGDLPKSPLSLIDIHGVNDDTIPYDLDHSNGQGNIIIDSDGVNDDLDQAEGQGNNIINSHGVNDNIFIMIWNMLTLRYLLSLDKWENYCISLTYH